MSVLNWVNGRLFLLLLMLKFESDLFDLLMFHSFVVSCFSSQPADGAPLGPNSGTRYDYSTQLEVVESPIANRNLLILSFHNRFVTHQRNLCKRDAKCVVASLSSRCVVVSFKVSNEASLWTTLT